MNTKNLLKSIATFRAELPAMDVVEQALIKEKFKEYEGAVALNLGFIQNSVTGLMVTPLNADIGFTFSLRLDRRNVPASVVNKELAKLIEAEEKRQGYKVGRKQRKQLKEDAAHSLLARAFTVTKVIDCVFHAESKTLIVDTSSERDSDMATTLLVRALGTLRCSTIYVDKLSHGITTRLREWVADDWSDMAFEGFDVGGTCKLVRKADQVETISLELDGLRTDSVSVLTAIDHGYQCKSLELVTKESDVCFTLTDKLSIRAVQHTTVQREEHHDAAQHWVHECSVRTLTVVSIMNDLCAMFGYKEPSPEAENENENNDGKEAA